MRTHCNHGLALDSCDSCDTCHYSATPAGNISTINHIAGIIRRDGLHAMLCAVRDYLESAASIGAVIPSGIAGHAYDADDAGNIASDLRDVCAVHHPLAPG